MARAGRSFPNRARIGQVLVYRVAPETGLSAFGAESAVTETKSIAEVLTSSLGTSVRGLDAKTAIIPARSVLGVTGSASDAKRAVVSSVCCLGTRSSTTNTKVAVTLPVVRIAMVAAGVENKIVTTSPISRLAAVAFSANTKIATERGSCAVGAIGVPIERKSAITTGIDSCVALSLGVDRRVATLSGNTALSLVSVGIERRVAIQRGGVFLGSLALGTNQKITKESLISFAGLASLNGMLVFQSSVLGVTGTGLLTKRVSTSMTCSTGFTASSLIRKLGNNRGSSFLLFDGLSLTRKFIFQSGSAYAVVISASQNTRIAVIHALGDVSVSPVGAIGKRIVCVLDVSLGTLSSVKFAAAVPCPWATSVRITGIALGKVSVVT